MNKFYKLSQKRISIVIYSIICIWGLVFLKLFYIQIIQHSSIENIVNKQTKIYKESVGDRGIISDRNKIPLSQNINRYTFWVNSVENKNDIHGIAILFSEVFETSVEEYIKRIQQNSSYNVLEKDVQEADCLQILQSKKLKGLNIDKTVRRYYPYSNLAAQLIGYTDLQNSGVIGIESRFNKILSGETKPVIINRKGLAPIDNNGNLPNRGFDIRLTIDIEMQTILQDELNNRVKMTSAKSANGVIIDPFTGEILAMATVPSLDLNEYRKFPVNNQVNKVISDAYEPGSTFKIITMAGKLESELNITRNIYNCENGSFMFMNKVFKDHEKHNELSLSEILVYSSNIGMIKIADELGDKNVFHYTRQFGFGSPTGISLPGESQGIVNPLSHWSGISGPEIAIGQEIAVNNLQLAMAYCAVANGGFLLKPHIVKEIYNSDGFSYVNKPQVVRKCMLEKTSLNLLSMLQDVVSQGTGVSAGIPGFQIAGKTGTAQKVEEGTYSDENFISSFAAIYPVENPRYVCIVSVDSPDHTRGYHWGSQTAAPLVKRIFERIIFREDKKYQLNEDPSIYVNTNSDFNASINNLSMMAGNSWN